MSTPGAVSDANLADGLRYGALVAYAQECRDEAREATSESSRAWWLEEARAAEARAGGLRSQT